MLHLAIDPHPSLAARAFLSRFPAPLAACVTPRELAALLALDADAPLARDERVRTDVRDMLRVGGYKPTGRGKPASEYLVRAAGEGSLGAINLAVDACNAVSLHSGFPISVVDLALARPPFRVAVAPERTAYVFNASGQTIDVGGLLCLFDADGACANAVRDAQRTKTRAETHETLSLVWGVAGHEAQLDDAVAWYRRLLAGAGVDTEPVDTTDT